MMHKSRRFESIVGGQLAPLLDDAEITVQVSVWKTNRRYLRLLDGHNHAFHNY